MHKRHQRTVTANSSASNSASPSSTPATESRKKHAFGGLLRRELHLHNFFNRNSSHRDRFSPATVTTEPVPESHTPYSKSAQRDLDRQHGRVPGQRLPSSSSSGGFHSNLLGVGGGMHARRESFLYKLNDEREFSSSSGCRPVSRASSVTSQDQQ